MNRREFLKVAGATAFGASLQTGDLLALPARDADGRGITLYNGIRLADPWPPRRRSLPDAPIAPPYLVDPPAVVPIDLGRQLFVDDFLIEESSLVRTFHRAEYHPANPVLTPATRWEKYDSYADRTHTHANWAAMPFSDGVFFDPRSRLFKMWSMGGYNEPRVEILDVDGNVIAPYSSAACVPVRGDSTCARVTWNSAPDLSAIANRPMRFRFTVTNGALYAFWVSADPSGASNGYVAAGGPGFTGPTDTVGLSRNT